MNIGGLKHIAEQIVSPQKGILAADESSPTIKKRFEAVGVEPTDETRRRYREILFTTEGIERYISSVILYDETLRQNAADGTPFAKLLWNRGILPGIKVDKGAKPLALQPGNKVTEGLDGLRDRLAEYKELGARFAKWRAVIDIDEHNLTLRLRHRCKRPRIGALRSLVPGDRSCAHRRTRSTYGWRSWDRALRSRHLASAGARICRA